MHYFKFITGSMSGSEIVYWNLNAGSDLGRNYKEYISWNLNTCTGTG
jgi:hypothetical protein